MDLEDLKAHFPDMSSHLYSVGGMVLYQGELPKNVYILSSGLIKMYSISTGGEERIVDFSVPGEILASSWVFGSATSTIYYYQALQECVVYEVPRAEFLQYIYSKKAAPLLLDRLTSQYTAALIRITSLEQARAHDKIIYCSALEKKLFRVGTRYNFRLPIRWLRTWLASRGKLPLSNSTLLKRPRSCRISAKSTWYIKVGY